MESGEAEHEAGGGGEPAGRPLPTGGGGDVAAVPVGVTASRVDNSKRWSGSGAGGGGDTASADGGAGDDDKLPETVRVLEAGAGRVYLVGTAHFSRQSQEDVARVIRRTAPQVVMVELCAQRTNILLVDEETILREARTVDLAKIRSSVAQSGLFNGLMYVLLLNMSAHMTRELGMAPGGEFRTALAEAARLERCTVQLGDRPIDITLQRALASLSWWQAARLAWRLLVSDMDISAEEVEKCKQKKLLEEMLAEMGEEFPSLKRVFVEERDVFLAHSLRLALASAGAGGAGQGACVVGVVGLGHVAGIEQHWDRVGPADIPPLLSVPPPALSTRAARAALRLALVGAALYAGYRLFPRRLLVR